MSTTTGQRADPAALLAATPTRMFLGGGWRPSSARRRLVVTDPATGETLTSVEDGTVDDALDALDAADRAQPTWGAVAPRDRADILRRAYELVSARRAELATLITLEMGKPLREADAEVTYAAGYLRWYAEEAVRINGRYTAGESGAGRILTMGRPVGPCLFVTPWNFPLAMGARKVAPALAAGCTCVVKPASQTPLTMLALAEILAEAGVPDGVVNVVPTSDARGVVGALMADRRLRKLSFTGSTETGQALLRQSADQVLRVSLELGGNAPFVVFPDADLDAAVDGAVQAKLRNNGEACTSANRFYAHRSVAAAFTEALAARFTALEIGHGLDPSTDVGPLIDDDQLAKVGAHVTDATGRGARVVAGGAAADQPGHFYRPTVLDRVPDDARLVHEEIFGPVAPVLTFDDEEDVIDRINDGPYGLAAYVFTRDLDRALTVAERLETGMVAVNQGLVSNVAAPFGGVKHSGHGREGGPEGIAEYLSTTYVALNAGIRPVRAGGAR
ncbi:NAD-dependent succinate-semialdehyde dehydrogenase [Amycolatopsis thermoflava]|uniref:NAD-dependent succinate-semialdehyde dehydrogenase n=1 Tax=Amycolatopsis thermoflava TaxID=84480 RepID=UPI003668A1D0